MQFDSAVQSTMLYITFCICKMHHQLLSFGFFPLFYFRRGFSCPVSSVPSFTQSTRIQSQHISSVILTSDADVFEHRTCPSPRDSFRSQTSQLRRPELLSPREKDNNINNSHCDVFTHMYMILKMEPQHTAQNLILLSQCTSSIATLQASTPDGPTTQHYLEE